MAKSKKTKIHKKIDGQLLQMNKKFSDLKMKQKDMTKDKWYKQLFERLDNSKFRSSFHLKQKDIDYINEKGCGRPVDDPA